MKPVTIAISALLAVFIVPAAYAGAGAPGHSHGATTAFGLPGNPKKPARLVIVTANEGDGKMEFIPGRITVKPGERIRFKITNHGELDHEFVLGTAQEIAEHAELMKKLYHGLLMRRVKPYYLYQCDPITGSSHFRTPVWPDDLQVIHNN